MQYATRRIYRIIVFILTMLFTMFVCIPTVFPKDTPSNFVLIYTFKEPINDKTGSKIIGIKSINSCMVSAAIKTDDGLIIKFKMSDLNF